MISRSQEHDILKQYEALLADERESYAAEEARLLKRRSGIERLAAIVENLSGRLGIDGKVAPLDVASTGETPAELPTAKPVANPEAGITVRHGRLTLSAMIRQIMADGQSRNAEAVHAAVQQREDLPAAQSTRQQIGNRLVELKNQGYLVQVIGRRGFYKLASTEAERNDAGREGPYLPIQPGVQKPPGEEVIAPRLGHPM